MVKQQTAFQTYVLKDTGGASPVLASNAPTVRPDCKFIADNDIILSGGFPSLFPKTDIPLSPTLQLNGDLATFSDEQLLSIGEAELGKKYKLSFSSRIVDADTRVCVISDNAETLHTFQDTYGGILEIEPRLLRGHHPDFVTATELSIDSVKNELILFTR